MSRKAAHTPKAVAAGPQFAFGATAAPGPERCGGCKFYLPRDDRQGNCRWLPPGGGAVEQATVHGPRYALGVVWADGWCGQYRPAGECK